MAIKLSKYIKLFLLDIIFPNRCPFCDEFIAYDEYCCDECAESFEEAINIICHKCGHEKCRCGAENFAFDEFYASFFYDEENVRKAIYDFKQKGYINIAEMAALDFVSYISENKITDGSIADMIVPVPMGREKQRRRGYNQAELFGKCISERLDIPLRNNIIFKYDTDDEQHKHTAEERKENVRTLFYKGDADLTGKTVLLCDDVMTTGATMDKCTSLLKELGAEKVIAVSCAVTRLHTEEKGA